MFFIHKKKERKEKKKGCDVHARGGDGEPSFCPLFGGLSSLVFLALSFQCFVALSFFCQGLYIRLVD